MKIRFHSAAQRRRRDIFVENHDSKDSSSGGAASTAPDGAWDLLGFGFYQDAAPDGALKPDEWASALHGLTPAEIQIVEGAAK